MTARAETVTILFTDLVNSTELLQRAGDEQAQRIFKAHHRLLRDTVETHGGHEVKWLGDGLMVAFPSALDAVRCAIAMQQASRRPAVGERLHIRVGLNVGETIRDESDYFGTPVVVARRLCDKAASGQIFTSDVVCQLLSGRREFDFQELGALVLKGIVDPVRAHEVLYEHDPLTMLEHTPFVGRSDETAALRKRFDDARAGRGGLTVLVGEPGIGKTRTAEEFCDHARSAGASVLWGRCYEGDWAPPFSPFSEAIKQFATDASDAELRAAISDDAAVLASMASALKERTPNLPEPAPIPAEGERYRLLEAVSSFFAGLAASRALVLVLDDLHWADNGTIAMLRHVGREAKGRRILLVGTYRDVELDRQHPLAAALADLRRETNFERITLKGLSGDAVGQLLDVIAEQDVPDALSQAIAEETGGNPFFIREILLHLVEEGKVVREGGAWNSSLSIAEMGIPEGVREVIGRRLSRLGDAGNRMLTAASAMTGGFTWDEIRAITDQQDDGLLDALDEALGAQVLRETAPSAYDFTHALIRHTLYEELSTPRRVLLHRQIGDVLERLYADDVEPHLAELAHHFHEAAPGGDLAKAIHYLRRAGDRCVRQLAYDEAVAHYERAAEFEAEDRGRCELLLALADALARAGMRTRAEATFERAGDIALRLPSSELLVRSALGAEPLGLDSGVSVRLVEAALAALPAGDTVARARCLAHFAPAFGGEERGGELSSQAVEMARRLGDRGTLAHALTAVYHHLVEACPFDIRRRLDIATEVLQIATEIGDKELALASGHCDRLQDLIHLGDIVAAEPDIDAHARLSLELRQGGQQCHTLGLETMRSTIAGRFAEAETLAAEVLALGRRIEHPQAEGVYFLQMLVLRREQGRLSERPEAFAGPDEASPPPLLVAARALLHAEQGEPDPCRRAVEAIFADGAERPRGGSEELVLAWLAEVCAWLTDRTRAAVLYELLLPYADRAIMSDGAYIVLGSGSRGLGLLAATMGRYDDAKRHFEDALAMNTRMGARPLVARTQLDYARMLQKRDASGDAQCARELLRPALATAQEIGMAKVAADCQELLASI